MIHGDWEEMRGANSKLCLTVSDVEKKAKVVRVRAEGLETKFKNGYDN